MKVRKYLLYLVQLRRTVGRSAARGALGGGVSGGVSGGGHLDELTFEKS